jgi:queuine/archaeosine tRNA-ribosyltransferase
MYTGMQHLQIMEGVKILRSCSENLVVDVAILSAGYGLISEDKAIAPYSVTFNDMKAKDLDEWAKFLNIHSAFESKIAAYDLIFVLLGEKYLRSLSLPVLSHDRQTLIFLASYSSQKYIKEISAQTFVLPLNNAEAKQYSYGLVGLKGYLFKQFAIAVTKDKAQQRSGTWSGNPTVSSAQLLQKIYQKPDYFKKLVDSQINRKNTKELAIINQLELPINLPKIVNQKALVEANKKKIKQPSFDFIFDSSPAPNIQQGMKYFIPEWDDLVDPKYDFKTDTLTLNRDTLRDDIYAHQIYETPNYDGILVSKTVIGKSKKKKELIEKLGIHKFLDWPAEIMGDCGAFSYLQEEKPPYTTEEILDYYENHGFNYGISIDHLIVGPFAKEGIREFRYDLTLKNAKDFINKHKSRGCSFTPIGAAQGWSPESYRDAVKDLISMGYDYIAVGGVARAKSEEIIAILQSIRPYLTPSTRLHLLGVGRINVTSYFRHLGVTSFDSASPLRKAWLDPQTNYYTLSGKTYIAVRIPSSDKRNVRIKRILEAGISDRETLKSLEDSAINSLRKFDAGSISLEETLEAILAYDKLLILPEDEEKKSQNSARRLRKNAQMYQELLEEKPWQKCDCKICREIGVEVIIFRGNNRNRRRGFHNTYIFYQRFQDLFQSNK